MMSGIGITGFLLIALIALLLFGPSKLPELGRAVGRTLKEFKKGASDAVNTEEPVARKEVAIEETQAKAVEASVTDSDRSRRLPE
jgi:sec-independent protein translocase protein TatA